MWASLREESLNRKLIGVVAEVIEEQQMGRCRAEGLGRFPMSLYNADDQRDQGFPDGAADLKARIDEADALIMSLPEYNHSIPGAFKNAIDWISRYRPTNPLAGKPVLLMSAAGSLVGGHRGLQQSRVPLEALGAVVYPRVFGLSQAHEAFDEQGRLKEPMLVRDVQALVQSFLHFGARL